MGSKAGRITLSQEYTQKHAAFEMEFESSKST